MKAKLMAFFVSFIRMTFSKDRLVELISDLLDILYDRKEGVDDVHDTVQRP